MSTGLLRPLTSYLADANDGNHTDSTGEKSDNGQASGRHAGNGWSYLDDPTVIHTVMKTAQDMPNKEGFVWLSEDLDEIGTNTFGSMAEYAYSIAQNLTATHNVKKGDSVLLVFNPSRSFEFVCAFFGCLLAGAIAVVFDKPSRDSLGNSFERIAKIADKSRATLALTGSNFYKFVQGTQAMSALAYGFEYKWPSSVVWQDVNSIPRDSINSQAIRNYLELVGSSDPAFHLFTNGPDGVPSGVMVDHYCLNKAFGWYNTQVSTPHQVVYCSWLTSHSYAELIGGVIGCAANGSRLISAFSSDWISDPLMWLKCMSKYGGTHTCAAPTILARCFAQWQGLQEEERPELDLKRVSCIDVAFEPASTSILQEFQKAFSSYGLSQDALKPTYGLADRILYLSWGHSFSFGSTRGSRAVTSIRIPQKETIVKIVKPGTLEECSPGVDGEVLVAICASRVLQEHDREDCIVEVDGESFLRSGDLGYVQDGSLCVLGRIADTIAIDGKHHHLQDIEATALTTNCPVGTREVAACALEKGQVGLAVEMDKNALVIEDAQNLCRTIVTTIEREHGISVARVLLVKPRSIPSSPTGEVQRQQLRDFFLEQKLPYKPTGENSSSTVLFSQKEPLQADRSDLAKTGRMSDGKRGRDVATDKILNIISVAAGCPLEKIDRGSSLVGQGISSLQAFYIACAMQKLCPEISFLDIVMPQPLDELIEVINSYTARWSESSIQSEGWQEKLKAGVPATPAQVQFVTKSQLETNENNVPFALLIKGQLMSEVLCESVKLVFGRHSAVSLHLEVQDEDNIVQAMDCSLHEAVGLMNVQDIRGIHPGDKELATGFLHQMLSAEISTPIDVLKGPCVRLMLLRSGDKEHVLLINGHAAFVDRWSMGILVNDICEAYSATVEGRDPIWETEFAQCHEFTEWQRLSRTAEPHQTHYWVSVLDGAPRRLGIHRDKEILDPSRLSPLSSVPVVLERDTVARLKSLCTSEQTSLFTALLAVFDIMLGRYSDQTDIVVGTPYANRGHLRFLHTVAPMEHPLAIRVSLSGHDSFMDLLKHVRDVCLSAFANSDIPYHEVTEAIKGSDGNPNSSLIQAMINVQSHGFIGKQLKMTGCRAAPMMKFSRPQKGGLDLFLDVADVNGTVQGVLQYSSSSFEDATVQRMSEHFLNLTKEVANFPEKSLLGLEMMSLHEKEIIAEASSGSLYPIDSKEVSLHCLFHNSAAQYPDEPCIWYQGQELTYIEVELASNRLAHYLIGQGIAPGKIVGVLAEKSMELVIGLLAILKSGAAFALIDPSASNEDFKLALEIGQMDIMLLCTKEGCFEETAKDAATQIIVLSEIMTKPDVLWQSGFFPQNQNGQDSLAYISLSTSPQNLPVGCKVSHGSIYNTLQWLASTLEIDAKTRCLQSTKLTSGLLIVEIFLPLMSGGRLILPDAQYRSEPCYWSGLIERTRPSFCCITSSTRNLLSQAYQQGTSATFRCLLAMDMEKMQASDVQTLDTTFPDCRILYGFGVEEAAVLVASCVSDKGVFQRDFGFFPIANSSVHIVDKFLRPCPIGVPGELIVSGICLGLGYANNTLLTEESFVANPFLEVSSTSDIVKMFKTHVKAFWLPGGSFKIIGKCKTLMTSERKSTLTSTELASKSSQPNRLRIEKIEGSFNSLALSSANYSDHDLEVGVPVSFNQERILGLYEIDPMSSALNKSFIFMFDGNLNSAALGKALHWLAHQHPNITMHFQRMDEGAWAQRQSQSKTINFVAMDLTYAADQLFNKTEQQAIDVLKKEASRPFDLDSEAPFRASLLRVSHEKHYFIMTLHQVICDEHSLRFLAHEFAEAYKIFEKNKEPGSTDFPLQTYDYAAWERNMFNSGVFNKHLEFWKQHLLGGDQQSDLPKDSIAPHERRFGSFEGIHVAIPAAIVNQLCKGSHGTPGSMDVVLTASFILLKSWISESTDVTIGTVNRQATPARDMAGSIVGPISTPLPLRLRIDKHTTFQRLLEDVCSSMKGIKEHGQVSGHKFIADNPPDAILHIQEADSPWDNYSRNGNDNCGIRLISPSLSMSFLTRIEQNFVVNLICKGSNVSGIFGYNGDLYMHAQVLRWAGLWLEIIRGFLRKPNVGLSSLRDNLWTPMAATDEENDQDGIPSCDGNLTA